jgi:MoaA/NifB/PqqE/SkfB family radical SAM enzyme
MTPLATAARRARAAQVVWRLSRARLAAASINLLNRCNQACPMCEVHGGPDVALSLDDLRRAVRALRHAGVRVVELSGGEPFLRDDLPDVVRLLDGARMLYTFNTNGTVVHDAGVSALRGAAGLLQVAVSLDSLDRERYRLLRGRDQLERALAGIERLRAARLPAPLKLNLAMSRHNEGETPALLEFARARGLFLSVFPVNQGPGAHRSSDGPFDATSGERERMAARFEGLAALRRRGEPLWEPSAFYLAAADFLRCAPLAPCGAGELYLDVRADGSVAPCVDLPPVATIADLEAGTATEALRAARAAVVACRRETPCCYTCTVNLAETGEHPVRWAVETARVLATTWWRRRAARERPA